ncbi:MAG TPA: hypothetical protein VGN01_06855 [Acidobacteriaceae bacterium]
MSGSRRDFLQNALMSGAFAPLLGTASGSRFFASMMDAAGQGGSQAQGAHDSEKFWSSFGAAVNSAPEPGGRTRGLFSKKKPDTSAGALDRQIDFFHYDTKNNTMRFATSIEPKELMDYHGDVQASLAVNGFRMAAEDRTQFQQLQSAQLRIDVVQTKSLMQNLLDPMAWTSLASLFPDDSGKLPPMQNLSFDPGAASQKMKQVILPGGSGQWAVNLSMAHKESALCSVLKMVTSAAGKFAPIVGLPQIGIEALQGFSSLYGAFESRTTFLINSFPQLAFATQQARTAAETQQGVNLVPGDYILVPHAFTDQLKPHLDDVELRQGYLVPKGSPTNTSVIDLALGLKPDITYLSATFGLKPIMPAALGANPSTT